MKFEEKLTDILAQFVIKFHIGIFIGAVVLGGLCFVAALNIKMQTEIKDMLPENSPKIQTYIELDELFSAGGSTVMITIEWTDKTNEPDRNQMIGCAEEFVREVESNQELMKLIRTIKLKLDKDFIKKWSLMLAKAKDLKEFKETFTRLNVLPFITTINDSFEKTYTGDEAEEEINTRRQESEAVGMLSQFESFFTILREYLENPAAQPDVTGRILAETFIYGESYNFNYDNTMLMFTITPDFDIIEIKKMTAMMSEVKAIQKEIQAHYPDLAIGYTGEVAVGADEMDAMTFDMWVPAIVALAIILLLFIFSFTQIRAVVFVIIALIFGIIFTFGFLGITIGEVNLMTSMLAVMLVGLGVDYGIQFVSNFNTYRADGLSRDEAIINTFQKAGMGIILAALTTAIGFFVLAATGTKAFSQFGVVMGMGIISCLIAMMILLPAILYWWGRRDFKKTRIPKINFSFLASLGKLTHKYSKTTIIIAAVITAGLLASALFLNQFEYDFMKMEPQDMPSIVQYKKILEKYNMNPFSSLVIADSIEEARDLTEKLEKEKLVAQINSISYLVPPEDEQDERLKAIAEIRDMGTRYEPDYTYENRILEFVDQIYRIEDNVIEIGQLSVAGLGEDNLITKKRNSMIHEVFGAETGKPGKEVFLNLIKTVEQDKEMASQKLTALDSFFAKEMDDIITSMSKVTEKMSIDDLPESYIKSFFNEDRTKNLITIFPEKYIMDHLRYMERFNEKLNKISPEITGMSQIIVEWMDELITSTPKAGLFIFIAVLIFIIITFRSIRYILVAIIPLVAGMIWMLGVFPLFGFKFDMMNFLLIPLIIGMGIDYAIHLAHRHKTEGNIENTYRFTGKGVFLSAATTMIGFGSLGLIGQYPAIAGMGAILFFGIAGCLLSSFIILPALLGLVKNKEKKQ